MVIAARGIDTRPEVQCGQTIAIAGESLIELSGVEPGLHQHKVRRSASAGIVPASRAPIIKMRRYPLRVTTAYSSWGRDRVIRDAEHENRVAAAGAEQARRARSEWPVPDSPSPKARLAKVHSPKRVE
jgi:hypothetical protein